MFIFLSLRVYVRLLIDISLSLALNVCTSFRIYFDWLYVHIRLWVVFVWLFFLNICSSDRLYYHSSYVSMSVAWSVFVSLSLTLSVPIAVFGCTVTDFSSIGTSLDRRICLLSSSSFLFFSVYGYIIGNSACIGTSLHSCFFLYHSV